MTGCSAPGDPGRRPCPTTFTTVARLFRAPDEAWSSPTDVRGRRLVVIDGALLGDLDEGRAAARAPAGPATRDRHLRRRPGRVHRPHAPGPRGADRGLRQQRPARRPARDTRSRHSSPPPARTRTRHCSSSRSATSAAPCRDRRQRPGVLDRMAGDFLVLGVGIDDGCRLAGSARRDQPRHERAPALGQRHLVPADGRRAGSRAPRAGRPSPRNASKRCARRPTRTGCSCRLVRGLEAARRAAQVDRKKPSSGPAHRGASRTPRTRRKP